MVTPEWYHIMLIKTTTNLTPIKSKAIKEMSCKKDNIKMDCLMDMAATLTYYETK